MPGERFDLGGAAFHLVITSDQFNRALAKARTDAQAEVTKINAALAGIGRGGTIGPKVNAAPANQALGQIATQAKVAQAAANFTATPKVNAQPAQAALGGLKGGFAGAATGALALGAGLAGVTVGIGLTAAAIHGSIEATREAQQATFALNATYGAGASTFAAFANEQAKALGRTSAEFKQAAVTASTLARNYGFTSEQIQGLIKRSTDLAAVQGLSVVDATNRVTSAMRGEAEAAELLGLTLNSDAIKAMATMTVEQRKNWETLDILTKSQITYTEFLRQTASVQGAAAKAAADGLTVYDQTGAAFNRLGVEAGNSIDPIGKGLAGAFRDAADAVAEFIRQQRQLPGWAQRATALSPTFVRGGATDDPEARRVAQLEALRVERGKQASQDAQIARAEATRLAAIARESQSEITRSALENISKRRAAAESAARDERERITDVRDASIAESNAQRDAALASLDREAQARARARTQEDRARADAQDAELRGLETTHAAVLRNLDSEQAGVERKRDAALKALDEEARREDQRHSAALRNIDAERDRKLGVLDAQLAALDAAAQRDQRALTDQGLTRSLGDARSDFFRATTREEQARARRAIADAEAAIRREAVNRQREDARAAIRVQQEQIRATAEAQKTAEESRNTAATAQFAARKTQFEAQAQVEIGAIKTRVDAENAAYAATVQTARAAHEQISRAIADSRQAEDDGLAARRQAVQADFAQRQAAIKETSDAEITALEQSTEATTAELERQKEIWSDWARHVEKEIAAAITAGDPSRIRALSATPPELQNAGQGPGEPPSRGNIPASFLDSGRAQGEALAAAITGGVSAGLAGDSQTARDVEAWVNQGIIDPAHDALEARSPSRVFERLAGDAVDGFVQGLQGSESTIGQAMVAVFDAAWAQHLQPWFTGGDGLQTQLGVHFGNAAAGLNSEATQTAFGARMFNALQGGYEAHLLPFFTAEDGLGAQLGAHFATAAGQLNSASTQRAIGESMRDAMTAGLNLAVSRQQEWWRIFERLGENLATSMANGFIRYSNANPLPAPTAGGGDAQASAAAGGRGGSSSGQRFGQYDAQTYLIGKGYVPGTADFNEQFDRLFAYQSQGYRPPPDMVVTGHINGGWMTEPTWLVNARTGRIYGSAVEDGRPERILSHGASIRTASTLDLSGLRSSPVAGPSGRARGGLSIGTLTVQVPAGTTDPRVFATQIVREVVNIFDAAERGSPDPAPGTLGGA